MRTEVAGLERSPLQWLEWLAENSGDMTISSMALGAEVVVSQVAEMGAAALRAQAERVRVLEVERDEANSNLMTHMGRISEEMRRAEAAERRAGELEGLLEEASNAMRMTALAMEAPLGRPTKKHVQHWTSLFHAESQRIRSALLPATQAEGEK